MSADAEGLREARDAFEHAADRTSRELERRLEREEARSVGWDRDGDGASVGHETGSWTGASTRWRARRCRGRPSP